MPDINMNCIAGVLTLALVVVARLSFAQQIGPLRCYNCITDYKYGVQDPGCPISGPKVTIRPCPPLENGFDRCISYRAINKRTGNVAFRRHCATREICEYSCLFSHHTNCEKLCCQGDLCNDANFGPYEITTGKPQQVSTTTTPDTPHNPTTTPHNPTTTPLISENPITTPVTPHNPTTTPVTSHNPTTTPIISQNPTTTPLITQNPTTTSRSDPTERPRSTSKSTETKRTTNAPVTTQTMISSTTEEPLVGGPPTRPGCQDYRYECVEYAAYPAYCQYTRSFMLVHCPRSCRFCVGGSAIATTESPTRPVTTSFTTSASTTLKSGNGVGGPTDESCADAREECTYFADFDGYCQYHYGFMDTYCPKACDFCEDGQSPQSPAEKTSTEQPEDELSGANEPEARPKTSQFEAGGEDKYFGPGTTPFGADEQFGRRTTPFGPGGEDYEDRGCIDLRENCTLYATKYEDYCNYNKDFMEIYCPFSCGFCGTTVPNLMFPHPPIIRQHHESGEEFPPPPGKKDFRWLPSFCNECENGLQECNHKCILLLRTGIYEPTSNDACMELLGKPNKIQQC